MNLLIEQKDTNTENKLMVDLQNRKRLTNRKWTRGGQGEGLDKYFGKVMYTLLYLK